MKRNLIGTLSLVVLSLLLGVTGASAQSSVVVKANVPFAFKVGKQPMPAGTYRIDIAAEHQNLLIMGDARGTTRAYSQGMWEYETRRDVSARLVFHRIGSQYFLAEIWGAGNTGGMKIPASRLEKELRLTAGPSEVGQQVVIALR